jgi:formamidopyrimidine-DNA glycosylase
MSIEMPEATILTRQMQAELPGKIVAGFGLQGADKLQRMGFFNKDSAAFERLSGERVESVVSSGNTMIVEFTGDQRLILFPEYGGEIFFHKNDPLPSELPLPARYHFRLDFHDGSALTVRIASIGGVHALDDAALAGHYVVRRDFDPAKFQPDDEALSPALFAELLAGAGRQLKSVLVGKDAVVVGISNSAFQDIIYRARLHPKRRASDLSSGEARALYDAMRLVVDERLRLGGKIGFSDLYGRPGGYEPAMGPAMKGRDCPVCETPVQKLAHRGGEVFVCPRCQV